MLKLTIGLLILTLIFSACMVLPCQRGQIAGINSAYVPDGLAFSQLAWK